jgi:SSS family transporter
LEFSPLDYAIGAAYFVLIPLVGILVGRRERDLGEYFLGGRRIPWWAVWLSILAAEVSAATFVGAPAFAYKNDWTYVQPVFGTIIARFVVAFLFLRPFYDLNVTTVYGYLEKRFGPRTRQAAAAIFLVTRVLASGVRLYGGALVLNAVLGDALPVSGGILLLAGVTLVYTLVGGIKAVVATDAIQVVVMFGGAIAAAAAMMHALPGDAFATLPSGKLRVFDLGFSLRSGDTPTLWGGVVGGAFITMASHGTDQDIVQRLLTAKDVRSSRRALIASGFLDIPIVVAFLAIGTLLFTYFHAFPDAHVPAKTDEVFPYFIATKLPRGLAGLVVAGVLSVAMGSLSAAMNALASTVIFDFWKPYWARVGHATTPAAEVGAARVATFACATLLAVVALIVEVVAARNPTTLLLVIAFKVIGYTYGALLGVFLRGFLTRGSGDSWNLVAMAVSIATVAVVGATTDLEWTWFVFLGTAVTFFVGWAGGALALLARLG